MRVRARRQIEAVSGCINRSQVNRLEKRQNSTLQNFEQEFLDHALAYVRSKEPVPLKFFVDFWDYFGHFSIKISGVIYSGDITPEILIEKRLKRRHGSNWVAPR